MPVGQLSLVLLPSMLALLLGSSAGCSASQSSKQEDAGRDAAAKQDSGSAAMNEDAGVDAAAGRDTGSATVVGPLSALVMDAVVETKFEAKSAIFGFNEWYVVLFDSVYARHQTVTITDFHDTCGNNSVIGQILYIDLFQGIPQGDAGAPDASTALDTVVKHPGTFTVSQVAAIANGSAPSTNVAVVQYVRTDASGGQGYGASQGTVTVTSVSATEIVADFDLTFPADDSGTHNKSHITGSFRAVYCENFQRAGNIP